MKNKTEKKISDAENITKFQITDKIKVAHSDRFDQMLMSGEIVRNDVVYINYRAKYVNVSPQKMVFAMSDDVALDFEAKYTGMSDDIAELDNEMIRMIRDSKSLIAEKSLGEIKNPDDFNKMSTLQYLPKGFMDSKEAVATETADGKGGKKEEKGFMESLNKAMNEPIGGSSDTDSDDDDDDDDFFESIDWFDTGGESESAQYELIKKKSFKNLTFEYNGEAPTKKQPLHYVPYLTKVENCKACKGQAEVTCPTCKGTRQIKCKGEVKANQNAGPVSNIHYSCSNGKLSDGTHCGTCGGPEKYGGRGGYNPCERKYGSKYGIGKLADMASGKSYCGGKGVIPCKPCKATGRIGTLVYVKVQVAELDGEFYQYTNQKIDQIQKKPNTLYPYLRKSDVKFETVFTDTNGSLNDNYDKFSSGFVPEIENKAGVHKGNEYPRLMHEEVFYDVIPLATLEYNHILTASNHLVSAIPKEGQFDILFHSDPTAVKKFSFKNIFLIYTSKWSEAFMTKSYKDKRDKYNEIRMLIYVAKADGNIAEEEKVVLANAITGMTEYTASEKSKLFGLMSAKELPPITDDDFVISTRERADITFERLHQMAMEDHVLEKPEVIMVKEYKEKINSNLGRYQGKFKHFVKTWQVSLSILLMLLLLIFSSIYFIIIEPKEKAEFLHTENLLNERKLLDYIKWINIDTLVNFSYTDFISKEKQDYTQETLEDVLNKIKHPSLITMEGSDSTYASYWEKHTKVLKTSFDSLMPILTRRIASSQKPETEQKNEVAFTPDGKWYTVSDPDGFSNLRESPNGNIIKEIYEGTIFHVIGIENGFKKVSLEDGTEGFIHASKVVEYNENSGVIDEPTGPIERSEENDQ